MKTSESYYRRHYGTNRLYVGIDKNGRSQQVYAYSKKEAAADLRKQGFRPIRIVQS